MDSRVQLRLPCGPAFPLGWAAALVDDQSHGSVLTAVRRTCIVYVTEGISPTIPMRSLAASWTTQAWSVWWAKHPHRKTFSGTSSQDQAGADSRQTDLPRYNMSSGKASPNSQSDQSEVTLFSHCLPAAAAAAAPWRTCMSEHSFGRAVPEAPIHMCAVSPSSNEVCVFSAHLFALLASVLALLTAQVPEPGDSGPWILETWR